MKSTSFSAISMPSAFSTLAGSFIVLAGFVALSLPEAQAGGFCHRPRVIHRAAISGHHGFHYGFHHGNALQLGNVYGHSVHKPYGFHYDLANVYVSVGQALIEEAAEERLLRKLESRRAAREALNSEGAANSNHSSAAHSGLSGGDTAPSTSPLGSSRIQELFNTNCTRCHSSANSPGGIDLTNADALTSDQKAKAAIQVDLGLMPPGGQQVNDEDAYMLKLWAAGKADANGRELE